MAFASAALPRLRAAVADLSLLLERGYPAESTLRLVGDRHALTRRQRAAVARCACAGSVAAARRARMVSPAALRGQPLAVDGFNVVTTLEVALAGGVVLLAVDGTLRDIAGVHGTHRLVEETAPAVELVLDHVAALAAGPCTFLFDRPVSNSGRIAALVADRGRRRGLEVTASVVDDPDPVLAAGSAVVASADGAVLDRAARWFNLARECVAAALPAVRIVDL